MSWQQNTILMILTLLGAAALASFAGSGADILPKGWSKAGSHPQRSAKPSALNRPQEPKKPSTQAAAGESDSTSSGRR